MVRYAERQPFFLLTPQGMFFVAATIAVGGYLFFEAIDSVGDALENKTYTAKWGSGEPTRIYEVNESSSDGDPENNDDERRYDKITCRTCKGSGESPTFKGRACLSCGGSGVEYI